METIIDDFIRMSFTLTQKHLDYLKSIDMNQSSALRKALDYQIQKQKKDAFRDNLLILCIGCIFLFFSTLTPYIGVIIAGTVFGLIICMYSVGRIVNEIRRTRN